MEAYEDGRLLFLTDAGFQRFDEVAQIPVISGWRWNISGAGKGCLMAPDGKKHCKFDLMSNTLAFEPDGEAITAPGLSASLVQEMGEKYAYDIAFSDTEKNEYDKHLRMRENTKKIHDHGVYDKLTGVIQLERKGDAWLAYVDADRVKSLTGIESAHVMSVQSGIDLFNQMSEKLHAAPLRDPVGYMALKGNMYEFIQTEYRNQYENVLQAIDNQMIDGTGYGVSAVLDNLRATVRKNITQYCLPKGENFGDLRFLKATGERKDAVREFVKCRVSKTLTYEKKRSYEKSAIEKTDAKYEEAGKRLKEALFPSSDMPAMEA